MTMIPDIRLREKILALLCLMITILAASARAADRAGRDPAYPITPVSFTDVTLIDDFWSGRIDVNRTVTIPFGLEKCEEEGRIRNFERAGGLLEGEYEGKMPFDDTDVYKIIEGAAYSLATRPDPELAQYLDDIILKISAAQEDDGYLCTWKTIDPDTTPAQWVQPGPRWFDLGASHELYNAGHLYEAAAAHYRATGKNNFLNVALKNADLLVDTFGPGKRQDIPGHQIVETGLVKLFQITGNRKYLDLAKFFLDQRGRSGGRALYGEYSQDHKPVIEQDEAVGHAVRAAYMYAGMTDIAAILSDSDYRDATDRIWDNVVSKKIYITGGIGASRHGEAFGDNYELPNLTSYNETCAAIANIYWNHRLFLMHGDAKYIDVLERTLYNGMISGVSLKGDSFFYPNCLESDGEHTFNMGSLTRQPWFNCSCCPSNVIRFLPSVPGYIYAGRDDSLYVNLFIASMTHIELQGQKVGILQESDYPWDGHVMIQFNPETDTKFVLNIRIPGWVMDKPMPGDLYHYLNDSHEKFKLKLNGKDVEADLNKGYAVFDRKWSKGDMIEMELPMPVRRFVAHEKVTEDHGKVALGRGPLVYCAEWADNGGTALDLVIPDGVEFQTEYRAELLNGLTTITGDVSDQSGKRRKLTAIPYYAWSHRGPGEMAVWLPRKASKPEENPGGTKSAEAARYE